MRILILSLLMAGCGAIEADNTHPCVAGIEGEVGNRSANCCSVCAGGEWQLVGCAPACDDSREYRVNGTGESSCALAVPACSSN